MPTPAQIEASREIIARKEARAKLLPFIRYTAPWFKDNWHHHLICELLERIDGIAEEDRITVKVGNTSPTVTRMCKGEEKQFPNSKYKERKVSIKMPKHIKRLMVFAPPRHSKSEIVSIRRPAWTLGRDRTRMFMNIAYGSDLAQTFSKACTGTISSASYQRLFPVQFDRKAVERWKVKRDEATDNQRDSMIASGIMSPLTGEGATDANIDDPFKNKSEAYSKTIRDKVADEYQTSIRTRLQRGAAVCLMLTRWHQDDLAGRLIKAATSNKRADQWIVLVLAATNDDGQRSYVWNTATNEKTYLPEYDALWPGLFDREDLETTRASMAGAFWDAMYMQAPTTAIGSIFKADKWKDYDAEQPISLERAVHVWDTALEDTEKADFSAFECMGIANNRFIVNDAYRDRLEFPDLIRKVYEFWQRDLNAGIPLERLLIERKGSGISLIQQIEANNIDPLFTGPRIPVLGMPATLSKEIRALSVSGYQEAGLVSLPRSPDVLGPNGQVWTGAPPTYTDKNGVEVEWVADFIEEHTSFPKGSHDDWVDCTVHGLTFYTRPIEGEEEETIVTEHDTFTISDELDNWDNRYI